MLLPTLEELAKLEKIVADEQKKRAKFQQELIDKERERFIKAKELEALQLRSDGEHAAAEALEKHIAMMKEAIRISAEYGVSLKEAAEIAKGIEENKPKEDGDTDGTGGTGGAGSDRASEDTRGDFVRDLSGKDLKDAANKAGKEDGIRFQKLGDGTFQQFVNGSKGGKFTEDQLKGGLENKIEKDSTDETLKSIEKILQGKFINE